LARQDFRRAAVQVSRSGQIASPATILVLVAEESGTGGSMSLKNPITRYRPTRTPDGEGGFTETLGAAFTVYGSIQTHADKTELIAEIHESIEVGDILVADGAKYRVLGGQAVLGTRKKSYKLERVERPIVP
jgi:hypothetical protein